MSFRSYFIASTPRSGSTLLCDYLKGTGACGWPESHFHAGSVDRWVTSYGVDISTEDLASVFQAAIAFGTGASALFGARLQQGSIAYLMATLRRLYPELSGDPARIEATFGPTAFVHLTREDKLDQAISQIRAMQSGLWHRDADGAERERLSDPRESRYDADLIAGRMADLAAQDQAWRDWFKVGGLTPLTVTYDALCADPEAQLRRTLRHLGQDEDRACGLTPTLRKLADEVSLEWKTRFLQDSGRS